MRIKPLTGQVLVVMMPEPIEENGIALPDNQEREPNRVRKGLVVAMGPWKRSKSGFGILPDFGVGATVLIRQTTGTKLAREVIDQGRLVKSDDVLAVLT